MKKLFDEIPQEYHTPMALFVGRFHSLSENFTQSNEAAEVIFEVSDPKINIPMEWDSYKSWHKRNKSRVNPIINLMGLKKQYSEKITLVLEIFATGVQPAEMLYKVLVKPTFPDEEII